jgi:hypothetical protein
LPLSCLCFLLCLAITLFDFASFCSPSIQFVQLSYMKSFLDFVFPFFGSCSIEFASFYKSLWSSIFYFYFVCLGLVYLSLFCFLFLCF